MPGLICSSAVQISRFSKGWLLCRTIRADRANFSNRRTALFLSERISAMTTNIGGSGMTTPSAPVLTFDGAATPSFQGGEFALLRPGSHSFRHIQIPGLNHDILTIGFVEFRTM